MEAGLGNLGGILSHNLRMRRHVYKSQSPPDKKEFLSTRVAKGRVGEMWSSMWRSLVTQGMQEAEVLKAIFTSIFTNKIGF